LQQARVKQAAERLHDFFDHQLQEIDLAYGNLRGEFAKAC